MRYKNNKLPVLLFPHHLPGQLVEFHRVSHTTFVRVENKNTEQLKLKSNHENIDIFINYK